MLARARADHGWKIFYAYSDRRGLSLLGDVGRRDGKGVTTARRPWEMIEVPAKGKYVQFVCDKRERRELLRSLRYPVLLYPKREPEPR